MKKIELIDLLAKLGKSPNKKLGQNFLMDDNLLQAMIKDMALVPDEKILEIGPGTGILSTLLLENGCDLTTVEQDRGFYHYLQEKFTEMSFSVTHGDAAKIDFNQFMNLPKDFSCMANLPYSISSIFIAKMLEVVTPPKRMFFLVQMEMAQRLCAEYKTKTYGSLTARCAQFYHCKIIRKVPPKVFFPPPKVDSAFISFHLKEKYPTPEEYKMIAKIVKTSFSQRRKKALKLLKKGFENIDFETIFTELEISLDVRAEYISPEQFKLIADKAHE